MKLKVLPVIAVFFIALTACNQQYEIVEPAPEPAKPIDVKALLKDKIDRTRNWHHYSFGRAGRYSYDDTLSDTTFAIIRISDTSLIIPFPQDSVVNYYSADSSAIIFRKGFGSGALGSRNYKQVEYYYREDSIVCFFSTGGLGGGGIRIYTTY